MLITFLDDKTDGISYRARGVGRHSDDLAFFPAVIFGRSVGAVDGTFELCDRNAADETDEDLSCQGITHALFGEYVFIYVWFDA